MKRKNHPATDAVNPPALSTPWTASVIPENVWKEYPRPAMARKGWINLNGLWDYAFTRRPEAPEAFDGRILVPFSPESPLSGVNRQLQPQEGGAESAPCAPASAPPTEASAEVFTGEADIRLSFFAGEEASVSLPDFHPWTPEDPFLYHLTVQTEQDRVECYFAMRKYDVQTDGKGLRRRILSALVRHLSCHADERLFSLHS